MEYTTLGKTDITVSKLCVGCMSFGKAGTMHDWTLLLKSISMKVVCPERQFYEKLTARYRGWIRIIWIYISFIGLITTPR